MQNYLPPYACKDAYNLHKKHVNMPLFCGQLAYFSARDAFENQENNLSEKKLFAQDDFLLSCTKKMQEYNTNKIHFYDCVLPERNLYYPSYFYHSLYAKLMLRNNIFKSYEEIGMLFGFLYKHNFCIESSSIRYLGGFASVVAYKNDV